MANVHGKSVLTHDHGALKIAADEARTWLFDELLPVWSDAGRDPDGGFVEQIGFDGRALSLPKRCRVQARQIYVFAEAGRLGWSGPWQAAMENGLAFLLKHYERNDGLMRFKVNHVGDVVDDSADNYDQAFTLFALAHAQRATGQDAYRSRAERLLSVLRATHGHPRGGFHESQPPSAPLRSNPHMHLLEAALAWMDVGPNPAFKALANEIGDLATQAFIDKSTGALRELFELDWSPAKGEAGLITEPGHQFEWAWLLIRLAAHGTGPGSAVAERLYHHGDRFGIDHERHVAINEVRLDGSVIDATARLWPQTERLKAALAMAALCQPGSTSQARYQAAAIDSWHGLKQYRIVDRPGLFFDKYRADGTFVEEPSFASSLYHITCAISELIAAAERMS